MRDPRDRSDLRRPLRAAPAAHRPAGLFALVLAMGLLAGCEGVSMGAGDETTDHAQQEDRWREASDMAVASLPGLSGTLAKPATVAQVQRMLGELGYSPGPVDGVMGKRTTIALKHFQVDAELAVDGVITTAVLAQLRAAHSRGWVREPEGIDAQLAKMSPPPQQLVEPLYEVGDRFVYSDGRVETVVRLGGDTVFWRTGDGFEYSSPRHFALPPLTAVSASERHETSTTLDAASDWPPRFGKPVGFFVRTVIKDVSGTVVERYVVQRWTCKVDKPKRLSIAAGMFDTVIFACDRSAPEAGTWKRRIWYYSPVVRHFIRRDDIAHPTGVRTTVELLAVRPGTRDWPPAARTGLEWAIQDSLSGTKAGETAEWRSSGVGESFKIVAGKDRRVSGQRCRDFILSREQPGVPRSYPAIACRGAYSRHWLVPGLDPGAINPVILFETLG